MAEEPEFESAITDAMRSQVGAEGPPTTYEVTTTGVRMFARAVGCEDPVFYDIQEAQTRGYRGLPAPPGYLGTAIFNPAVGDPMLASGRFRSPYRNGLNGGTDVEYFDEDICSGDVLSARTKLESLNERFSAALGGPMLIAVNATTYRNQDGKVVGIARGTGISYGPRREDA